ncbi:MAG: phosphate signaling complex protein PhoU [Planctomycetota bacterium]
MTKHFQRDLERVKKEILAMGRMVEEATNKAITALVDRRPELAREAMAGDDAIDEKELAIEEDCLKILALHQPVATDLRFVVAVMKVNNDLERMGDLAINIAERAAYLSTHDPIQVPLDFGRMAERVRTMLRESLDSLVNLDAALARKICQEDEEVDGINREMFVVLQGLMYEQPETIKRAVHTLSASRHLERIADLATNIAEDVVFMVEGEVIRHRLEDYRGEESG